MPTKKILLVEGVADQRFFISLLAQISLDVDVRVSTPKDHGAERDGKMAAFTLLDTLLPGLLDGNYTHLGIVLDNDWVADGWGHGQTLAKVKEKIATVGYGEARADEAAWGKVFLHPDGLRPFGLWTMPDNASEGIAEDWIKACVKPDEIALLGHGINVVDALSPKKFKNIRKSKAEVATWLAWQKLPGESWDCVIEQDLIDLESLQVKSLISWLREIYE